MILVAPTSFKGSITAEDAARALALGARDARADAEVVELPVSDGGPGLIDALRAARGGELHTVRASDPLGRAVDARVLVQEGNAIVESADACGMHLLDRAELDPIRLGSGSVGPLVEAAARLGDTVVLGLGGSATVDGGVGMAAALGWHFVDAAGRDLESGGGALRRLDQVRAPQARAFPRVVALADVCAPLIGPAGAARVFGPQKGASPADVDALEEGLARLGDVIRRDVGVDVAALEGAGAAGGIGAACVAFLGAKLVRGADWVLDAIGFDEQLARATLLVTGEGRWDAQSSMGKVTGEVIRRARRAAVPVLLVAGRADGPVPPGVRVATGEPGMLDSHRLRELARAAIAS